MRFVSRRVVGMLLAATGAAWLSQAHAEMLSLTPSKDNTLFEESGSLSNGAGTGLFAGVTDDVHGSVIRRAVLAFDVAGKIPPGATITSARLTLTMNKTVVGNQRVRLHRLLADWGEGTSAAGGVGGGGGAPATVGDATWTFRFFNTATWGTAGGEFAAPESAAQTVGGNGAYTWGSTAAMVADVQGWLDSPTTNFGWIVINVESTRSAKRFASREVASGKPALTIEYTVSTPTATRTRTPTPTPVPSATFTPVPTATLTRVPTATLTPVPTATFTPVPTATLTPVPTATLTPVPTITATAAPTGTATATKTATPIRTPSPTKTPGGVCVGDCGNDGRVSISDLILGVNIALGLQPVSACSPFANAEGLVTIAQLIQGVNNALNGCP